VSQADKRITPGKMGAVRRHSGTAAQRHIEPAGADGLALSTGAKMISHWGDVIKA
jgi:hypothetical protein